MGTGRRRWFSAGDKARMKRRSFRARSFRKSRADMGFRRSNCSPGAGRRGSLPRRTLPPRLRSSCLQSWNRCCRKARLIGGGSASVDSRWIGQASGIIEVEIEGVSVRVGRGADAKKVAVIIRALNRPD